MWPANQKLASIFIGIEARSRSYIFRSVIEGQTNFFWGGGGNLKANKFSFGGWGNRRQTNSLSRGQRGYNTFVLYVW